MTSFQIENIRRSYADNQSLGTGYLDAVANVECDFEFKIDGQPIIKVQGWNLVEFLDQLLKWEKAGMTESFHYECMDSEESLFDLIEHQGRFKLSTGLEKLNEPSPLTKDDLQSFIESLTLTTLTEVKQTLKLNLTEIEEFKMK
jgi:hypothetical protein